MSSPGVVQCMLVCGVVGCKPGQCNMEDRLLPMQHDPPLRVTDGTKGTTGSLQFGTSAVAGAVRTG